MEIAVGPDNYIIEIVNNNSTGRTTLNIYTETIHHVFRTRNTAARIVKMVES